VLDIDSHEFSYFSRDFLSSIGYAGALLAEAQNVAPCELIHPEDFQRVYGRPAGGDNRHDDRTRDFELRLRCHDGAWQWMRVRERVLQRKADVAFIR